MSNREKVLAVLAALLLLGVGIWANLGKSPMFEMRGAWVSQATRGRG